MKTVKEYNGYKNYQTWNVALWLNNDESLYHSMVEYADLCKRHKIRPSYTGLINYLGLTGVRTGDNVSFTSKQLFRSELTSLLFEGLV